MLTQIVANVRNDWGNTIQIENKEEKKNTKEKKSTKSTPKEKKPKQSPKKKKVEKETITILCPLCKKGHVLRGKSAFGCSKWKDGCTYRLSFDGNVENLSDEELNNLIYNR